MLSNGVAAANWQHSKMAAEKQTSDMDMKDLMKELLQTQWTIIAKIDKAVDEVSGLSHRISKIEKEISGLKERGSDMNDLLDEHRESIASLVSFNNPQNIIFYGLLVNEDESVDEVFRKMMIDYLSIETDKACDMSIHCQYLPRMSHRDHKRPIIVSFRSSKDMLLVRQRATKFKLSLHSIGVWAKANCSAELYLWKSHNTKDNHTLDRQASAHSPQGKTNNNYDFI